MMDEAHAIPAGCWLQVSMTAELKQLVATLSREANAAATEALVVAGSNALRGTGMLTRLDTDNSEVHWLKQDMSGMGSAQLNMPPARATSSRLYPSSHCQPPTPKLPAPYGCAGVPHLQALLPNVSRGANLTDAALAVVDLATRGVDAALRNADVLTARANVSQEVSHKP
jgi:hypothetical protein